MPKTPTVKEIHDNAHLMKPSPKHPDRHHPARLAQLARRSAESMRARATVERFFQIMGGR